MSEKKGFDPVTGEWNDSLTGDYLWSRNNFGEAQPDVMTPFTYSLTEKVWNAVSFLPGYQLSGNICGRYYANISVSISMLIALGKKKPAAVEQTRDLLGSVPEEMEIPTVPLSRMTMLAALPRMIKLGLKESAGAKKVPAFLARNPDRCRQWRQQIQQLQTRNELIAFWQVAIQPQLIEGIGLLGGATQPLEATSKFRRELVKLVGEVDAGILFSNLSRPDDMLASLGPVVGIARVAQGKLNRREYLDQYGHRGPHEMEISIPRPGEDPDWFDRQLAEYEKNPVDVDALLAARQAEFDQAWNRLQERYPGQAQKLRRKIEKIAPAARMRESVRDELTRFLWVEREWALRASQVTHLDDDLFLLTIDEVLDLLSGNRAAKVHIPARRVMYARYRALPPYPMIIRGSFDPFLWASDPTRRNDIYDATAKPLDITAHILRGFAGSMGCVEGRVRLLDNPEQGDQIQPGEILVAVTTNVGWTPLFPRVAAVVTDVGAPLSHAAIVACELGIPAVVGCGNATTRLRTGDRVRVDGTEGKVEIL